MVDILSEYFQEVELVLEENPVLTWEKILGKDRNVSPGEIIQLGIKIKKHWKKYSRDGVEMAIILTEEECDGKDLIYDFDFTKDISNIIKNPTNKANIYYLNKQCEISSVKSISDKLTIQQCSIISSQLNKIVVHLGIRGVDILVNGIVHSTDNFLESYKDLMDAEKMLSIYDYEKLVKGFYIENVQYDPNKRYFLRKDDIPKEYHAKTIEKYPKLLKNKPEEYFQMDFVRYLKNHCNDTVEKEHITVTGDRYDVLVRSEDDHIFVFEIKWLGRSITTGMKVFSEYNSSERANSGAYQLLDYVSNAEKYSEYFLELPVYCAILLLFDAREKNTDITYPPEVKNHPKIDLNTRLFMEKQKINASKVYSKMKRR